jgi:NADPH:quinone reductase-like Zn-dependent oxidoreductase
MPRSRALLNLLASPSLSTASHIHAHGNWNATKTKAALIREGKAVVSPPLPITLGADLSGIVESTGPGVSDFKPGEEIFGVTNPQFIGAYAEYACASAATIARKPKSLNFLEAASGPVVAVTAWQMLFDFARAVSGQAVLILGAAGNVGAYAVQLAREAGLRIIATASAADADYVRSLGAGTVLDFTQVRFDSLASSVDAVIDTVGGGAFEQSLRALRPGGILVSSVSPIPENIARQYGPRAIFFLVEVATGRLNALAKLFDTGKLSTQVGTVLPLAQSALAHQMLVGAPHARGQIVLKIAE